MWVVIVVIAVLATTQVARWVWMGSDLGRVINLLFPAAAVLFSVSQLRPRTRATDEGLLIRGEFSREELILWSEVQEIVADGGRWATEVTAQLIDGRTVKLPGVSPGDLDSVRSARPG